MSVQYCPTDDMTGDYMTKPLQGHKFKNFRKKIMNFKDTANVVNNGPRRKTYKDALVRPQGCVGDKLCEEKGKEKETDVRTKTVQFQDQITAHNTKEICIKKHLNGRVYGRNMVGNYKIKCSNPGLVSILRSTTVGKQNSSKREVGQVSRKLYNRS